MLFFHQLQSIPSENSVAKKNLLEKIVDLLAPIEDEVSTLKSSALMQLAELAQLEKDYDKALGYYRLALNCSTSNESEEICWRIASILFENKKDPKAALRYLNIRTFSINILYLKGLILADLKLLKEAFNTFTHLLLNVSLPPLDQPIPLELKKTILKASCSLNQIKEQNKEDIFSNIEMLDKQIDSKNDNLSELAALYLERARLMDQLNLTRLSLYDYYQAFTLYEKDNSAKSLESCNKCVGALARTSSVTPTLKLKVYQRLVVKAENLPIDRFILIQKPKWLTELSKLESKKVESSDQAIVFCEQGIKFLSNNVALYTREKLSKNFLRYLIDFNIQIANIYLTLGKHQEALLKYNIAYEICCKQYIKTDVEDANKLRLSIADNRFYCLLAAKNYDEAKKLVLECISQAKTNLEKGRWLICLAKVYHALEDTKNEEATYKQALPYFPLKVRNTRLFILNNIATLQKKNFDSHIVDQLKTLNQSKELPRNLLSKRIELNEHLGLFEEVLADCQEYENSVQLDATLSNKNEHLGRLALRRANIFSKQMNLNERITQLEAALKLLPLTEVYRSKFIEIYNLRYQNDIKKNNFTIATKKFAAGKNDPDIENVHSAFQTYIESCGANDVAYFHEGLFIVTEYEKFLQKQPKNENLLAFCHYKRGWIYESLGMTQEAEKSFKAAIEIGPTSSYANLSQNALDSQRQLQMF